MVFLLLYTLNYFDNLERSLIRAELKDNLNNLFHTTKDEIDEAKNALISLALSNGALDGNWESLYEHARRVVASNPHFKAVTLVDEHDKMLFVTTLPYGEQTFPVSYLNLSRESLRTGNPTVSGPFKVPIAEGYRLAITVPLEHNGHRTHVLRMIMSTDVISQVLHDLNLPKGWGATVTDSQGIIVARSVLNDQQIGSKAATALLEAIRRNDGLPFQGQTLEGVMRTGSILPLWNGNWFVAVGVEESVLMRQHNATLWLMGGLCAIFTLLGFWLAFVFANFLGDQMRMLRSAVSSDITESSKSSKYRVTELLDVYKSYVNTRAIKDSAEQAMWSATAQRDEIKDLYERAPCGYHSINTQGHVVLINETELNWLGRSREEVIGRPFTEFISNNSKEVFRRNFPKFIAEGHIEDIELELMCASGEVKPVLISATMIFDANGKPLMSRSTVFDITARKNMENKLEEMSKTDPLTGARNRRYFYEQGALESERARRHKSSLAIAMLDIDHFKLINDQHGHLVGDQVLIALSKTCQSKLRNIDIVTRFGGEEFVLLLPHTELSNAVDVCDRLRMEIANQVVLNSEGHPVNFTVSIGITVFRREDVNMDAALMRADSALYEAKRLGRNQVRFA